MIGVTIDVTKNTAGPALARLRTFLESQDSKEVIGFAARKTVRGHLAELESSRANTLGGPRSHYYGSARKATNFSVSGDTVTVSINQVGIRLHYFGGTVRAGKNISSKTGRPTRFLTIPATGESYGKSAASFDNLVLLWGKNGPYALARGNETNRMTRDGLRRVMEPGQVLFGLKVQVEMDADPDIIPGEDQLSEEIGKAVRIAVRRVWKDQQPENASDE
jgi:hypothetical protein